MSTQYVFTECKILGIPARVSLTELGPNRLSLRSVGGRNEVGRSGCCSETTLINQGTISSDLENSELSIQPHHLINEGDISVTGLDSLLTIRPDTLLNADGTITAVDTTVNLGGSFTLPDLGTFQRTRGTVNLTGTLRNADDTLAFDSATGTWNLDGGTIVGGAITQSAGVELTVTSSAVLDRHVAGGVNQQLCHVIDIMPTLLDAAGVEPPDQSPTSLEGRSFLSSLSGAPADSTPRAPLFWAYNKGRAVRSGDWKLVSTAKGPWELYNLAKDGTELHDLAATMPQKVADLERLFDQWERRTNLSRKNATNGK